MRVPQVGSVLANGVALCGARSHADGVVPSDCNCNYDCKWYEADCFARAAACRLACARCEDQCKVAYAAALTACAVAGPGYPGCAGYATTAYEVCRAAC
jgi:hypothetical protein